MNTIFNDQAFMAKALRLAKKGLYTTRNNPKVGCVIVKNNSIIGQGFHAYPGEPHAEINALNNVKGSAENATVYVTLEPCAHHGKTPPCIDSLIKAQVARVVVAMQDPNPLVNGKGLLHLQSNNIKTTSNIMASEAAALNKGFVQRCTKNRPYITVKSAISLDGKTALKSGESKWITSEAARKDVQKLRARSCAILTGIETILLDDPSLNVRIKQSELGIEKEIQQPIRIILDTQLRITQSAKILHEAGEVIIYTCSNDDKKLSALNDLNIEVVQIENDETGISLKSVMTDLSSREINEVLVEAGSTLVGSLLRVKLVDEMIVYMAPHIMGSEALNMASISVIEAMQDRIHFKIQDVRRIGPDLKITMNSKFQ
ncbi:MAG: bifunctional diaminohydroxyphosphoribosylaminopyrimidine deaminase/5-amino-6-(5-phosphoribosylamino)uracil reductase RibD [Pseudomonadota bacterium]